MASATVTVVHSAAYLRLAAEWISLALCSPSLPCGPCAVFIALAMRSGASGLPERGPCCRSRFAPANSWCLTSFKGPAALATAVQLKAASLCLWMFNIFFLTACRGENNTQLHLFMYQHITRIIEPFCVAAVARRYKRVLKSCPIFTFHLCSFSRHSVVNFDGLRRIFT